MEKTELEGIKHKAECDEIARDTIYENMETEEPSKEEVYRGVERLDREFREMEHRRNRKRDIICKPGVLLKICLLFIIVVFLVQYINIYLNVRSFSLITSKLNKLEASVFSRTSAAAAPYHTTPPHNYLTSKNTPYPVKAVIYTYNNISLLPHADRLRNMLDTQEAVFYINQPIRLLQNNFDGFNKRKPKSILRRLHSCDGNLLDKLYRLQFIRRPVRHCCIGKALRYKRAEQNAMINQCLDADVRIAELSSQTGLQLQDLLVDNSTRLIYMIADPRLVVQKIWEEQRNDSTNAPISIIKDIPVIGSIAAEYCNTLTSDIRTLNRLLLQSKQASSLEYLLVKYEDMVSDPTQLIDITNFLQIDMDEELTDYINKLNQVSLENLYKSVHLNVKEKTEEVCGDVMNHFTNPLSSLNGRL